MPTQLETRTVGALTPEAAEKAAFDAVIARGSFPVGGLFPTPLVTARLVGCEALNAALIPTILGRQAVERGVRVSNLDGWHSADFLPWCGPAGVAVLQAARQIVDRMTLMEEGDELVPAELAWRVSACFCNCRAKAADEDDEPLLMLITVSPASKEARRHWCQGTENHPNRRQRRVTSSPANAPGTERPAPGATIFTRLIQPVGWLGKSVRGVAGRPGSCHGPPSMTLITPSRPNPYTGSPLDRASHLRTDAAWIAEALDDPSTRFVPIWRGRNLFRTGEDGTPAAVFPTGLSAEGHGWAFLGNARGVATFALDLSAAEDPLPLMPAGAGEFSELRTIGAGLPADHAAILAHARGLMHWRSRHRFCGVCGAGCEPQSAGNVMACVACRTHHFPRTDPAVIMLVTRGDKALLGHSARFPNSVMYSTLAGFVEPGESLEEAVAREVREESGVPVGQVRYHSSQPWPFPASIMLGFYAEGLAEEIILDEDELTDARWFSRAEMRDAKAHGFALPRADSIARRLIEDWLGA